MHEPPMFGLTTAFPANDPRNINEDNEQIPEWVRPYIRELKEGYVARKPVPPSALVVETAEGFGRWCDEGGFYVVFRTQRGNLECTLYEVSPPEQREVAKFTLASFRAHQFWKWYNHVAPVLGEQS